MLLALLAWLACATAIGLGTRAYLDATWRGAQAGLTVAAEAGAAALEQNLLRVFEVVTAQLDLLETRERMLAGHEEVAVLGIEEHRLPESADSAREKTSGYLKVSTVRRLAEQAGFRYVGSSEVNANPRDTADWPDGVWTLPPVLRLGDKDRAKYLAIGESDRMTLRFVKPRG